MKQEKQSGLFHLANPKAKTSDADVEPEVMTPTKAIHNHNQSFGRSLATAQFLSSASESQPNATAIPILHQRQELDLLEVNYSLIEQKCKS